MSKTSFEKRYEFLREAKRQDCHVILLTSFSLKEQAKWLVEAINDNTPSGAQTQGLSHTEYICAKEEDGVFYFLKTSVRVGGAHIADFLEAGTGLNMWREWARVEACSGSYELPSRRNDYAGLLVMLLLRPGRMDSTDA